MKTWKDRLERIFTAAAFAEAGDHTTARHIAEIPAQASKAWVNVFQKVRDTFAAVAFAEANEPEMGLELINKRSARKAQYRAHSFLEAVGLVDVKVYYGMVHA